MRCNTLQHNSVVIFGQVGVEMECCPRTFVNSGKMEMKQKNNFLN